MIVCRGMASDSTAPSEKISKCPCMKPGGTGLLHAGLLASINNVQAVIALSNAGQKKGEIDRRLSRPVTKLIFYCKFRLQALRPCVAAYSTLEPTLMVRP